MNNFTPAKPIEAGCLALVINIRPELRVHMTHIGYPIVGDLMYGRGPIKQKGLSAAAIEAINGFSRQALHARTLKLIHPETEEECEFSAPLADDMGGLIKTLKQSVING